MNISIALVDDHPVICHGLSRIFEKEKGMSIVGEASDWKAAVKLIEKTRPDVAILDITLQGGDGISLVKRFRTIHEKIKIVMYTMHNNREYIARAFHAGALGYVLKNDKIEELQQAVMSVMHNRPYFSSNIPDEITLQIVSGDNTSSDVTGNLSPREYEIASLIAQGLSPDKIAEDLYISSKTVRVHRTNIMHKLDCNGVHELLLKLRQYFPQE